MAERPQPSRSISHEEGQIANTSANERSPLLPLTPKAHHRVLGLPIPLWLPRRYVAAALSFLGMTIVILVSILFVDPIWKRKQLVFMNNGTHDFRKTVIVMSFDGFRADYLQRGLTPHLLATGDSGLRARWLQPSFPASAPVSESLVVDVRRSLLFYVGNSSQSGPSHREPDVARASCYPQWLFTLLLCPVSHNITLMKKADQIFEWLDKPFDERPQLINVYEPLVDDTGHAKGPDSPEMTDALMEVDLFAHAIRSGLKERNLSSIVDVLFLSDHGMAPTRNRKWIYLDKILGEDGANEIEYKLGQPNAGLWFRKSANTTRHLEKLYEASAKPPHNFKVSNKHFSPDHNSRIPPIWVVPDLGWSVTIHKETDPWNANGDHGYDNEDPLMRAMFIASGPFTDRVRAKVFSDTSPIPGRFSRSTPAIHSKPPIYVPPRGGGKNGPVLIEHFENVQVYSLVMRLLGIQQYSAQTNGTAGYWDTWFDRD
ncbi:pyrophosphatase/phosphodiesterase [Ceratobasidium sp. AG-Ba]|nr:pyrophosphatase/phosphodiesterase [Ceratobasidium sp. AG-Ba]